MQTGGSAQVLQHSCARSPLRRGPEVRAVLLVLVAWLTACDIPRDAVGTLDRVRGGTLRVGVVSAPPYAVATGDAVTGPEAELVRAFARRVGADVEWRQGSLDDHMQALQSFELDLVAAGLTTTSPWKTKAGFTRPWRQEGKRQHVLAVPPGENALLAALESVIEARRRLEP